ncbi:unnamed protein product [Amoebophrya sp. A25]|nr:unnamed protein product [Amoebophrya sp. A25]|eukprot:GSA25T00014808001.1
MTTATSSTGPEGSPVRAEKEHRPPDTDPIASGDDSFLENVSLPDGQKLLLEEQYWNVGDMRDYHCDGRVFESGAILAACLRDGGGKRVFYPESEDAKDGGEKRVVLPESESSSSSEDDRLSRSSCSPWSILGFSGGEDENSPTRISGHTVIDLGTGTGVSGLAVAKMRSADRVILTDLPAVLDLTRRNVKRNNLLLFTESGGKIVNARCCMMLPLLWGKQGKKKNVAAVDNGSSSSSTCASISSLLQDFGLLSRNRMTEEAPAPLTIIGTDLVYAPEAVAPLLETVETILNLRGDLTCFATMTTTGPTELIFLVQLRRGDSNRKAVQNFVSGLVRLVYGYPVPAALGDQFHAPPNEPEDFLPPWPCTDMNNDLVLRTLMGLEIDGYRTSQHSNLKCGEECPELSKEPFMLDRGQPTWKIADIPWQRGLRSVGRSLSPSLEKAGKHIFMIRVWRDN